MEYEHLDHVFGPIYDKNSEILILGSFPSVKSREISFYYGHPQNRFWVVLEKLFDEKVGTTIEERRAFLFKNRIAVWDVIQSCDIIGSSDSSIKNVVATDLDIILSRCEIRRIFINGKTAARLYDKYIKPKIDRKAIVLPSTSPANAAFNLDKLFEAWKIIKL
ncbi:MAG: DNA-deoxyinosine glycosylase [Clostridiales bacterium GWF2_36_10]|nr:MAG: DNA-deoxyinosine glycosylase [Clostridiales bacterium GWF2_36_10]HAN21390.1 DNA-deoxyinosine glycosylase [Clostridiales bacterium]